MCSDALLDAKILKAFNRFNFKVRSIEDRAQMVQNMIEEKKLILDQEFDHELTRIKCSGDGSRLWMTPPPNSAAYPVRVAMCSHSLLT